MNTYKLRFGIVLAMAFVIGLLFAAVPGGSVNAATKTVCSSGCDYTTIQAAVTGATAGDTITVAAGTYNETVTVGKSVTITLADAVVVNGATSCFAISADNVTLNTASNGGAKCKPGSTSNGIAVTATNGTRIIGLEVDGTTPSAGDGINVANTVQSILIQDNYIHGFTGDGIEFAGTPAGSVVIKGNLITTNTGIGINAGATTLDATYNSWGDAAAPTVGLTAGSDVSTNVDADPWTHVALSMAPSGTSTTGQVLVGTDQITFTVSANLVNVQAADVTFNYDSAKLTYVSATEGAVFGSEATDEVITQSAGTVNFRGSSNTGMKTTVGSVTLFTVTFSGAATAFDSALTVTESNEGFAMAPAGPSTNIYAYALPTYAVDVVAYPTLAQSGVAGPFIKNISDTFTVTTTNPSDGGVFPSVTLKLTFTTAATTDLTLLAEGSPVSLTDNGTTVSGLVTVTLPAAGANVVTNFQVTYSVVGTIPVTVELFDTVPTPDDLLATTGSIDAAIYDNLTVTGTISMQGRWFRGNVPVRFEVGLLGFGPYTSTSTDVFGSTNFSFTNVGDDTYVFTTNQPRYLNVTVDLSKSYNVTVGDLVLTSLELKGGNAIWSNNTIDVADASAVGTDYGKSSGFTNADSDVNFDGKVNIFDLAMVGGNYNLTSATAYASWTP
ncbi:MAG: DUF1565 domain-containing protein [Bellilinea sp.]